MESQLLDVYQTILVSPSATVASLLDENPGVVNLHVWQGLTLLHHICMRGTDEDVISVLTVRGADVNSRSEAGETPLHYACRKGNLPIVSQMLKSGADANAVDNAGHGCMHFAAQGNAVSVMVYLHNTSGLPYDALSSSQQNALHIAALHGHWQVSAFLLRNKRCDAHLADIMGNTALHLAAMKGGIVICHQIVSSVGHEILKVTNSRDETALQIAHMGPTIVHRETEVWLKNPSTNPNLLWISKLVLPPVCGCILPLIINICLPAIQIIYWVIVMFVFGCWIHMQHHRLVHPSKWSNPARAGVFVWGISSNLVLYFGYLSPVTTSNWIVTFLSWSAIFLIAYSTISFYTSSPGIYNDRSQNWDQLLAGIKGAAFCDECEIIQTPGVRHCRMCGKCYRHLQHHCLFLLRCVTAANDKYFLLILVSVVLSCVAYAGNFIVFVQSKLRDSNATGSNAAFNLVDHFWLIIMLCADIVGAGTSLFLIRLQLTNPYGWQTKHNHRKNIDQA